MPAQARWEASPGQVVGQPRPGGEPAQARGGPAGGGPAHARWEARGGQVAPGPGLSVCQVGTAGQEAGPSQLRTARHPEYK